MAAINIISHGSHNIRYLPIPLKDMVNYLSEVYDILKSKKHVDQSVIDMIKNLYIEYNLDYRRLPIQDVYEFVLDYDAYALIFLKNEDLAEDIIIKAIKREPGLINYILREKITKRISKITVEKNPKLLKFIPEDLKTYKLCYRAISADPFVLNLVPDRLKNYKLCFIAAKKDIFAYIYIPTGLKNIVDFLLRIDNILENMSNIDRFTIQTFKKWYRDSNIDPMSFSMHDLYRFIIEKRPHTIISDLLEN